MEVDEMDFSQDVIEVDFGSRGPSSSSCSSSAPSATPSTSSFTSSTDPEIIYLDADDEDDDEVARRSNYHSVTPEFQWTAPGPTSRRGVTEFIIDPKATTTPFVQNVFQNIFKNQIRPNSHSHREQGQTQIYLDGAGEDNVSHRRLWFVNWLGNPINRTNLATFYNSFESANSIISVGDFVLVRISNISTISKIVSLSQNARKERVAHVVKFFRGHETVLGHASDPREIFASTTCQDVPLESLDKKIVVKKIGTSEEEWRGSADAFTLHPNGYWFRFQFCDESSRFENIAPFVLETFQSKTGKCRICEWRNKEMDSRNPKFMGNKFALSNITYSLYDAVFLTFGTFEVNYSIQKGYAEEKHPDPSTVDKNRYPEYYRYFIKATHKLKGNFKCTLDPLQIGIIEKIMLDGDGRVFLKIRQMLRPENITDDPLEVSKSDLNLLYWTETMVVVDVTRVEGKCVVLPIDQVPNQNPVIWAKQGRHRFYYQHSYSTRFRRVNDLSYEAANYRPPEESLAESELPEMKGNPLATLDIFSGCGGLSYGLEKSGVAKIKWGIEFEEQSATAFQNNHPDAKVLSMNVNDVLIHLLNREEVECFPRKGEVEFICCGPPCQGFSGLNRFRDRDDAQFNNSQIAACLSYLDFFRPKYFLMENVKNMFSHQSGVYLKLILRAIVGMGYQVTEAVLQAGNYGVPQDRSRAFVLAAAPSVKLPVFPEPETAFVRPSQSLNLDGKIWHTNSWWKSSAPYRNVTCREAISDLPRIHNGSNIEIMDYRSAPESHIQKLMRWNDAEGTYSSRVLDHICKNVSPLMQARISLIPTRPGADWRDLPNIVWQFPDGTKTEKLRYSYNDYLANDITRYTGVCKCQEGPKNSCRKKEENQKNSIIPWAKVHTAARNGMWAGCYGRVAYESHFSTVTTDPEPEAKQGRVVHPDIKQKRVFSVRELARAQGMPDSFILFGSIDEKYKQVGNAVPPPVGRAIGLEIRKALAEK